VPRDLDKMKRLLKAKEEREKEGGGGGGNTHIEDTQRLVTDEIEMLKVAFCI
jgi:hypothetical protein